MQHVSSIVLRLIKFFSPHVEDDRSDLIMIVSSTHEEYSFFYQDMTIKHVPTVYMRITPHFLNT